MREGKRFPGPLGAWDDYSHLLRLLDDGEQFVDVDLTDPGQKLKAETAPNDRGRRHSRFSFSSSRSRRRLITKRTLSGTSHPNPGFSSGQALTGGRISKKSEELRISVKCGEVQGEADFLTDLLTGLVGLLECAPFVFSPSTNPKHFKNRRCRQENLTKRLVSGHGISKFENRCTTEFALAFGLLALFADSIKLCSRCVNSPGGQRNLKALHR